MNFLCKFTFAVLAVALSLTNATLLRSKSEATVTVAQAEKLSLFCETEDPFDYCQWDHIETQTKCNLASNDVDSAIDCRSNSRIIWDVTPKRCGIYIEKATREDIGTYQCTVFQGNASDIVQHSTKVDVAVPALVTFTGQFSTNSEARVKTGDVLVIECQAMGGYPAPQLRAALGNEPNTISVDPKADHLLEEISAEEITNPDATVDVKKKFTLLVQSHDCGKFVKCEASQVDKDGKELFGRRGRIVENRKLMVLFAPEPLFKPLPPFSFGMNEAVKTIKLNFMANPAPANNMAIWHINPTQQLGPDSIVVQAGSFHKDKYEALPLNVTGHSVEAVLHIKNPVEKDVAFEYFLEVSTEVGTQRYNFVLEYRPQSPLLESNVDGEAKQSTEEETGEEPTSGMGIGIVIGIILIVILVLGSVAGVILMRANKRFCFAEGTPKPAPVEGSDRLEKGEGADPAESEKLNTKNNGV